MDLVLTIIQTNRAKKLGIIKIIPSFLFLSILVKDKKNETN